MSARTVAHLRYKRVMDRLLYSKRNAAELLSVSLRKLDSLIATNQIQTMRIGKRVLISREALENFVGKRPQK